ncbi:uncharacterized protein LOC117169338 isoform X2 [Belonocnema kinseyi]|uniref:uncharacterized protein LOC117169338 isoform X2 n=1 Tax=Belonocnema kinseyi TaxID=2817044 RepID=UPI00143D7E54|nr:uncharacterized protein LOC117169338 isoform X2 [Belonocnema kinseyi]
MICLLEKFQHLYSKQEYNRKRCEINAHVQAGSGNDWFWLLCVIFIVFGTRNMRNIEIKARVDNLIEFLAKVKNISDTEETVIPQKDIFFNLPADRPGRLKLRKYKDGSGDLVYYNRPDTEGPKLSNFEKTFLTPDACNGIEQILSTAYGTLGIVEKVRLLYLVGQTRIHVDEVTGLGGFV